jgi:hypothetical protein
MGFIGNLFGGGSGMGFKAQSGLQPGQLEQTYQQQQDALAKMAAFAQASQAGGGQGMAAQQALSEQLAAMGRGEGPSAAQAMLQQQAGNVAAQQAALMGSQRGASQNVGLVGRQAAQAGLQAQQQAASQAAIQRANEQFGAMEQLRALSGQQVGQQQAGIGMYGQSALQAQGQALDAVAAQQKSQAAIEAETAGAQADIFKGITGAVGKGVGKLLKFSEGGTAPDMTQMQDSQMPEAEKEESIVDMLINAQRMAHGSRVPGVAKVDGDSEKNDTVPALLSPGEIVVPRSAAKDPEKAAAFAKSVAMRSKKGKKK